MNNPTYFVDDAARTLRAGEVPNAAWGTGMDNGGGNTPGLGIATDQAGLEESLPEWTLLDQHGNARAGQIGQHIGGLGYSDAGTSSGNEGTAPDATIRVADPASLTGDGQVFVSLGNATLTDLAVGWTAVP